MLPLCGGHYQPLDHAVSMAALLLIVSGVCVKIKIDGLMDEVSGVVVNLPIPIITTNIYYLAHRTLFK